MGFVPSQNEARIDDSEGHFQVEPSVDLDLHHCRGIMADIGWARKVPMIHSLVVIGNLCSLDGREGAGNSHGLGRHDLGCSSKQVG